MIDRTSPRRRSLRAIAALGATAVLLPLAGSGIAGANHFANADLLDPVDWPSNSGLNPGIEATQNTLRIWGPSRGQTNLGIVLAAEESGTFPFDGQQRTDAVFGFNGSTNAAIIVANDNPADSFAAASLVNPGDNLDDPTFVDTDGDSTTFDTQDAFIVSTKSARNGATGLSSDAIRMAQHLFDEGADQAIIMGGSNAVHPNAVSELKAIGYVDVAILGGATRADTARLAGFGRGLGDGDDDTVCSDDDATNGVSSLNQEENSDVPWWTDESTCTVLDDTVALVEGFTGADAVSQAWWLAQYAVPVALVLNGQLPDASESLLQTLSPSNIIRVGGPAVIPDSVVTAAAAAAGIPESNVHDLFGNTRHETSIEGAIRIAGMFPPEPGNEELYSNQVFCFGASSGSGAAHQGWPDNLAGGPACAVFAYNTTGTPDRVTSPVDGGEVAEIGGSNPFSLVPVLTSPVGASSPVSAVESFLEDRFPASGDWATGRDSSGSDPGFGFVFGGDAALPDSLVEDFDNLLNGGARSAADYDADHNPMLGTHFYTELELGNGDVFDGANNEGALCFPRGEVHGAVGIHNYDDAGLTFDDHHVDVLAGLGSGTDTNEIIYEADADGTVRSPGTSSPVCNPISSIPGPGSDGDEGTLNTVAVSPSGAISNIISMLVTGRQLVHSDGGPWPVSSGADSFSGDASDTDDDSSLTVDTTTLTWGETGLAETFIAKGQSSVASAWDLTVTITRGDSGSGFTAPDTFTGSFTITAAAGTITGTVEGEAICTTVCNGGADEMWTLEGWTTVSGGTWANVANGGLGGFEATIDTNVAGSNADDTIVWEIDALLD